jgi:hypothetical protein
MFLISVAEAIFYQKFGSALNSVANLSLHSEMCIQILNMLNILNENT